MHTAEPKRGCCNKNIWLLSFTTQSNSGSQCCLVTMAHYWPYLCGHKNVWRRPPIPPPRPSSPPSFRPSYDHTTTLAALISPSLSSILPGGNHPPLSPTPARAALRWVLSAWELPSLLLLRGPANMYTLEPSARKKKNNTHTHTHNGLVCTVCAFRTQQIQQWWAGGGRLEGCRLHAMKLIDSCKNRGTQSSAKETQYHTARWAGAPAFVRILLQSGICALPAAGEKKHGRVWEDVLVCMRQKKYCVITSALSRESQMCSICETNLLVRDEMYLISIHSWELKSQVQLF